MSVSKRQEPIQYLNGLRGIAILMVLMIHVSQLVKGLPGWAADFTFYGVRGVQLFFIISGLTLTIAHKDKPLRLADFAARRFFRVAPMFYVGAALYLSLAVWTPLTDFMPKDATLGEVVKTLLFVHGWSIDANNKIVPGGWSIAAEAMFYWVFPVLLAQARRSFLPLLLSLYVLAGVANLTLKHLFPGDAGQGFAFSFWLCHLPAFATGCWLALGVGHDRLSVASTKIVALIAAISIVIDSQLRGHSNLLVSIALLSTFVWAVGKWRPAFLESRFLTRVGEISFSLYILHFALLSAVSYYAPQLGHLQWELSFVLLYAIALGVGSATATLSYVYIEKPFIRLGRTLFQAGHRVPVHTATPDVSEVRSEA